VLRYPLFLVLIPFILSAEPKIEIRNSQTVFTFFSFVTLNKYNDEDTVKLNAVQKHVRNILKSSVDKSYQAQLKTEFDKYNDHMFEYWLTMLALNCSEPPLIESRFSELQRYNEQNGLKSPSAQIKELEEILPVMNEFYTKADINLLHNQCKPWYDSAYAIYYTGALNEIRRVLSYLKIDEEAFFQKMDRIVIVPNLIGPRGSAMGPEFFGVKYDVQSPYEEHLNEIEITPHEYIHDMVKHLTKSDKYNKEITAAVDRIWNDISGTDAAKYYNDKVLYFDECLVRTIDHITSMNDESILRKSLEQHQAARGFVLTLPMMEAMKDYAASEKSFDEYFPDLLDKIKN
jgi:hypothetical protein